MGENLDLQRVIGDFYEAYPTRVFQNPLVLGQQAADNFFRLFGDGDGDVDATDYAVHLLPAMNSSSVGARIPIE